MTKKISNKDKKDWQNFINNKEKVINKDFFLTKNNKKKIVKKIDLHGLTLVNANEVIKKFIKKSFNENVNKIIVITGKGLRSKNLDNPYVSKDLGILKYSVPEFIESQDSLMKMIIDITDAKIEDGGSGAFYVYLKSNLKNKF